MTLKPAWGSETCLGSIESLKGHDLETLDAWVSAGVLATPRDAPAAAVAAFPGSCLGFHRSKLREAEDIMLAAKFSKRSSGPAHVNVRMRNGGHTATMKGSHTCSGSGQLTAYTLSCIPSSSGLLAQERGEPIRTAQPPAGAM